MLLVGLVTSYSQFQHHLDRNSFLQGLRYDFDSGWAISNRLSVSLSVLFSESPNSGRAKATSDAANIDYSGTTLEGEAEGALAPPGI